MVDRPKTARRTPPSRVLEQDDDQPRSAVLPSLQRVPLWVLPASEGADEDEDDSDEEE